MNFFDSAIIEFINQFAQLSWSVDNAINFISENKLFKGLFLLVIFIWGWFKVHSNQMKIQSHLVSTIIGCFVGMLVARILALSLPFRPRPIHLETLDFTLPHTMIKTHLEGWSSFPSDHAVLFYALATGMFYISKKAGILAIVFTTLFVAFPRVYLGLHYPTDILAGAFIGIVITLLFNSTYFIEKITQYILKWSNTKPEFFYPIFFIVSFQIVDMFDSSRNFVSFLLPYFKRLFI